MTVKEIERRTGLPRASVRFYEREGLIHPARQSNGYRDYSEEDCRLLKKIRLCRELGCSVEEIRDMQEGIRTLDVLLERCMGNLETVQAERKEVQALCRKMHEDGVRWDTLDPAEYLAWKHAAEPVRPEVPDVGFRIPWRRLMARAVDLNLCVLVWLSLLGLLLRQNVLHRGPLVFLDSAAALILMILLEPVFLHRWGTTPGKLLFGLRLTRQDGSFFACREARRRTIGVAVWGLGLGIPLVQQVLLVLAWRRCRKEQEQPWAREEEAWDDFAAREGLFWRAEGCGKRVALLLAMVIGGGLVLSAVQQQASMPPYRGPVTAEQFAANYNRALDFADATGTPDWLLNADGTWQAADAETESPPPEMTVETDADGFIAQVSFEVELEAKESGRNVLPIEGAVRTMLAAAGKSSYIPLWDPWRKMIRSIQEGHAQTWRSGPDGWEIACVVELEGYRKLPGGWLVETGEGRPRGTYRFWTGQDLELPLEVGSGEG